MIRRPTPPLDFDETMALLEQTLVGGYVTIGVFEPERGHPSASFGGFLTRLDVSDTGGMLVLRADPDDASSTRERPADSLWVPRSAFRAAGEALDADDLGPLVLEFGGLSAVVSGRDVVPDWDALER